MEKEPRRSQPTLMNKRLSESELLSLLSSCLSGRPTKN